MATDPSISQDLLGTLKSYIANSQYTQLAVTIFIIYLPAIGISIRGYFEKRSTRLLYEAMITQHKSEIERQALRIKELESLTLRSVKRK